MKTWKAVLVGFAVLFGLIGLVMLMPTPDESEPDVEEVAVEEVAVEAAAEEEAETVEEPIVDPHVAAFERFLAAHPGLGLGEFHGLIEDQPDWACGSRRNVITTTGRYLVHFAEGDVQTVAGYGVGEVYRDPDGTRAHYEYGAPGEPPRLVCE